MEIYRGNENYISGSLIRAGGKGCAYDGEEWMAAASNVGACQNGAYLGERRMWEGWGQS